MYLPVTCTMRATDIWRGMIALNILQNDNQTALFFGTTMLQNRNIHNLSNDLIDEMPLYKNIRVAYKFLKNLKLKKGSENYSQNLIKSYQMLIENNIFNKKEMYFLKSWIKDLKKLALIYK